MDKIYYLVKDNSTGAGALTLIFESEKDRELYISGHDYCSEDGTATQSEIYCNGNCSHWGVFVELKNNKFYDAESGVEL